MAGASVSATMTWESQILSYKVFIFQHVISHKEAQNSQKYLCVLCLFVAIPYPMSHRASEYSHTPVRPFPWSRRFALWIFHGLPGSSDPGCGSRGSALWQSQVPVWWLREAV